MAMSPYDCNMTSKFLTENPNWDSEKTCCLTVSFTPGSCTLTAYKVTPAGYEWGKNHRDLHYSQDFNISFYEK